MKNKQIIGIVVAAVVFVFVCASSVLVNSFSAKSLAKEMEAVSSSSGITGLPTSPYVGIIDISGAIMDVGSSTPFQTVSYDHQQTLKLIEAYKNSRNNKGILLELNTPGGGVYESDEVYLKLMEYKEETGRPIWAYMKSQACSGGYYIAMSADEICADRNCWTGSIGVIVSLTNYKELMDKFGVKEINITSGTNKAMGSAGEDLTDEQYEILQGLVDEAYDQFLGIVSKGRNMPVSTLKPLADGRIYTAKQAMDKGLIDSVDTYDNFCDSITEQLGEDVKFHKNSSTSSIWSSFLSSIPKQSRSDLEMLDEMLEKQGSGVPMYYANTGK